jgi:hypothetical protein
MIYVKLSVISFGDTHLQQSKIILMSGFAIFSIQPVGFRAKKYYRPDNFGFMGPVSFFGVKI